MDKTVKFNIKVTSNGKSVFHEIEVGADDFREAVSRVNDEIKESTDALGKLAKSGMAFSAIRDAIDAVQSVVGGLADEYDRFDKAMRSVNTMAGLGKKEFDQLTDSVEELAGSGDAVMQILKNKMSNLTSFAGKIASTIQPVLTFTSALGQGITGATMLKTALDHVVATSRSIPALTRTINSLKLALFGATNGAIGLKQALRAALITSGIGIAVLALTSAMEALLSSISSASDELDNLTTSARQLRDASQAYSTASADAKAAIDMELVSLRQLIDSHADDKQAVSELNSKYGEAFGTYQTASQWYDVLTQKSETYCRAIGMEAQARELATKKAQNELRIAELQAQMKQMREAGTDKETTFTPMGAGVINTSPVTMETQEYRTLREEAEQLTTAQDELTKKFEYCTSAIAEANKELQTHTDGVRRASEEGAKADIKVELNGLDETKIKARLQQVQQERDKAQGNDLSALTPAKPWEEVQDGIPDKLQVPEIEGADRYTTQLTEMQQQTTSAFDSFKTAWGGLKGMGSGIGSITNSLTVEICASFLAMVLVLTGLPCVTLLGYHLPCGFFAFR